MIHHPIYFTGVENLEDSSTDEDENVKLVKSFQC